MTAVFIGLGSNLDSPRQQVSSAIEEIAALPKTSLQAQSSLYRSSAVGPGDQPDYINAVVQIDTSLTPETLLEALQTLENSHGRVRGERWGARTLDLDILLFGLLQVATPHLTIPHPRLEERNFVLLPLAELDATITLPSGRPLASLLNNSPSTDCWQIE